MFCGLYFWDWEFFEELFFNFVFVVYIVEFYDMLEENVEFRMRIWVFCDFKKRLENVDYDLFEGVYEIVVFVYVE